MSKSEAWCLICIYVKAQLCCCVWSKNTEQKPTLGILSSRSWDSIPGPDIFMSDVFRPIEKLSQLLDDSLDLGEWLITIVGVGCNTLYQSFLHLWRSREMMNVRPTWDMPWHSFKKNKETKTGQSKQCLNRKFKHSHLKPRPWVGTLIPL